MKFCRNLSVTLNFFSLGGAISVFGALDIFLKYDIVPSYISFESPRVGNKAFAKYIN